MTSLAIFLSVCCVILFIGVWMLSVALDRARKERDQALRLYTDAIKQLEQASRERDYYKREWAARWDAHARDAVQPVRHVGAGEYGNDCSVSLVWR